MVVFDHYFRKLAVIEFEGDAPGELDRNAPIVPSVTAQFVQSNAWGLSAYLQVIQGRRRVHDR